MITSNPGTMAINTGVDVTNLLKALYGFGGHELGLLKTEEMPEPIDPKNVVGSSAYIRNATEENPESTAGFWGHLAGGILNPQTVIGAARTGAKLLGGATAKNAPPKASGEWFTGPDGAPRFEINDQYGQLKGPIRANTEAPLSTVLDHPELYDHYPDVKRVQVKALDPKAASEQVATGQYRNWGAHGADPETGKTTVWINPNLTVAQQRQTILHEIGHNIQGREGWAGGTSPAEMMPHANALVEWLTNARTSNPAAAQGVIDKMAEQGVPLSTLTNAKKLAQDMYLRSAGEIEARTIQKRANMSRYERQQTPFPDELPDANPLSWDTVKGIYFGNH